MATILRTGRPGLFVITHDFFGTVTVANPDGNSSIRLVFEPVRRRHSSHNRRIENFADTNFYHDLGDSINRVQISAKIRAVVNRLGY